MEMPRNLFTRQTRVVLVIFAVVFIIYWYSGYMYWLVHRNDSGALSVAVPERGFHNFLVRPNFNRSRLRLVPVEWIQGNLCPACYGMDMCDEIKEGQIMIEIPANQTMQSSKGVYYGTWRGLPIVVKRLAKQDGFNFFDQFICKQAKLDIRCDVSKAILHTAMADKNGLFSLPLAKQAFTESHRSDDKKFTPAICMTDSLVESFKNAFLTKVPFDKMNDPGILAMMYTNLVLNPEGLMLNFFTNANSFHDVVFPNLYGACGRIIVAQDAGLPLIKFLRESWRKRVEIAIQLISLIDHFLYSDVQWLITCGDIKYDNFVVGNNGYVKLIDAEDVALIDRNQTTEGNPPAICNADCFRKMMTSMEESLQQGSFKHCSTMADHSEDLMKALMCNNILSDVPEHKTSFIFGKPYGGEKHPGGLLHSPPSSAAGKITRLMSECVHETLPGQRNKAWAELSDLLTNYSLQPYGSE